MASLQATGSEKASVDEGTSSESVEVETKASPPVEEKEETKSAARNKRSTTRRTATRKKWDLSDPELYLNRELTWLNFNRRVLHEAEDERTPLLERVKFVAIVCSNLDEFFMKRIGGLKQQIGAGITEPTIDGRTPREQIDECHGVIREIEQRKNDLFDKLLLEMRRKGIELLDYEETTEAERRWLRNHYYSNFFPLVTPQGIDPAHPFPFISNLSLNLLVSMHQKDLGSHHLARVKVPLGKDVPRFIQLPETLRFVRLEDVMSNNLDLLFPRMEVESCELFRVTRNAVTELDEEQADDLLAMIETELRYRKFAPVVRLQVAPGLSPVHRGKLGAELELQEEADLFEIKGMMGKSNLMEIAFMNIPELRDPAHHPIDPPRFKEKGSIFHNLRDGGPVLLALPYESFNNSVERFLKEAAWDPKVRGIKMTLYRTSSKSKIIGYLVDAARNNKQVTVVVELKARFDEAANINWANQLEEAGIHVTYGVVGLKTHAKTLMVIRRDYDRLRRYAHIGTGNYHSETAGIYTDFGIFTCEEEIGQDLTEFFNYLSTGFTPKRNYRKLIVAPADMKKKLIAKIEREIEKHTPEKPGRIVFKMNALEDPDITRALYRAGMAGVPVDLITRDTCRLRPGLKGLSESIRVISIVGRFLEHSRVYYFRNGGENEFFIGSADTMKRNLESRVEVLAPIENEGMQKEMTKLLEIQLSDNRSAWEMQSDGTYIQLKPERSGQRKSSQQVLIEIAEKRQKEAGKVRRLKSKGMSRKEYWAAY
ncbi:MAG: polyphosphate kinase 1 [Acidobacteriota bacterium]|nr:polyphosphate kinase 1 [Acidobacteriota bacterium]